MLVTARDRGENYHQEKNVDLSLPADVLASLRRSWIPVVREFDLPPGAYQARMVVKDRATRRTGAVVHRFTVPARQGLRTSTPVLSDRLQALAPGAAPVPALVAHRSFPAGGKLFCQFDVLGAAPGAKVSVGFELRSAAGAMLAQSEPAPLPPGPQGQLSRLLALPLDKAQPGPHELAIVIRDEATGANVGLKELFEVVAP